MSGFFSGFADGSVISRGCRPGQRLRLGMSSCAVTLRPEDAATLHMPLLGEVFTAPWDAESCIVSLRDIPLNITLKDLISFQVQQNPRILSRLGLCATLTLRVSHIHGFSNLLRRSLNITSASLFPLMEVELQPLVIAALTDVLGSDPPEYSQILERHAMLQSAVENALFVPLFAYGLCIRPHSFAIRNYIRSNLY